MQTIPAAKTKISLHFRAEDGAWTKRYITLKGAQKEAARMIGATPELGLGYAVSMFGTTLRCDGCTLADLFPALAAAERNEDEAMAKEHHDRTCDACFEEGPGFCWFTNPTAFTVTVTTWPAGSPILGATYDDSECPF
jgi:hypothetical protein